MTQTTETWLTQEAFERLQEELADRSGPRRAQIVKRIEAAREEGDLKENGGYHAAKEEQGKNEARVKVLTHLLENAKIGAPPATEGEVAQGQVVTVRLVEFNEEETFLLGSREEAATASISVYSPTSPLGAAVLGRKVGTSVSYTTPAGKTLNVEILKAEPYTG
ncbi:transcription elongation factor GreA [Longivirga aurantiaca]|uniref:Transcription elongation factor GreA n=1 Tax=Longivirga aurantiaca TaxID=1837743 RepID=A0ABW1SY31_9ACTN